MYLVGLTIQTDPNINPELQLVSHTDCITSFRFCPLISIVEIRDAIFTRSCLDYGEHWWDQNEFSYFFLNHWHSLVVCNQQALEPENFTNDKGSCSRRTRQTNTTVLSCWYFSPPQLVAGHASLDSFLFLTEANPLYSNKII